MQGLPLGAGGESEDPGDEDSGGGAASGELGDIEGPAAGECCAGEFGDGEGAAAGERGAGELLTAEATLISNFIPPAQCPGIPQMKYLFPAVFSETTVLPPVPVVIGFVVEHEL